MNKNKVIMSALLFSSLLGGCKDDKETVIEKPDVKITNRQMTPEVLEAFGKVSELQISPDAKKCLFTISYSSIEENASNAEVYTMDVDGSNLQRLTHSAKSESNVRWFANGEKIAFVYYDKDTDKPQLFVMNADGSNRKRMSALEGGVNCFEIAPDEKHIVMGSSLPAFEKDSTLYHDLPLTTGRVVNDLMYKHWDEWVTEISHPFVAEFGDKEISEATDIMAGEPYECPIKPFGGAETFAWTPDGKKLVYTCRKLVGREYAESTNSDLYLYDLEAKTTENLTEGNMGYDTDPKFSPDGSQLAWLSMETPSYESDKKRLMVLDMATKTKRDLTENWDWWPEGLAWAPNGKDIFFHGYHQGTEPIFKINVSTCKIDTIAEGVWDYQNVCPVSDEKVVALRHSMKRPNEICVANGKEVKDISEVNKDLIDQLDLGDVELKWIPTTDGKLMATWIILPPNFDKNKKYPALLYCQGGPQQAVSQFWSYRWNFMMMASNGYVIIAPNRRGLPGFGTEWNREISGDYGGQNMKDYFSAVDYMKNEPYIDGDHIGAVGASYGGFSVYWLAGHHEGRFAALVAHAGIFNMEAQYLETEEMWFANFDMGGAPWDTENAVAQRTFANSPHKFVNNWTAPILVTVGELDYRILASQGMMAFNAAKLHGLDAEMLVFPDENHWVIKPQNAVLWQRTFFQFLDKYLKTDKK
jgi:dipeptidyl aminopeptidase/acylaminoacyl peptidase